MAAAPGLQLPPPLRLLPPLPLLLLLPLLAPPAAQQSPGPAGGDRRFSEHKVCGDAECSLLMYQGEALEDFKGPDCRFVNFKKGDSVFVYYKLTGILPEVWAGSVGQAFGYFPKDFIRVANEYTKEELQVPADETDFVCFNGGRDDFTNYSVEELLAYLELPSPASKDSEEAIEKDSRHVEPPTEVSENRGPLSPPDSSSEGSDTEATASTQVPEDGVEAPTEQAQAMPPSSEPEAVQHDASQVPAGDSNRTSNSSQGPGEQPERMDAYKLLKQDMTLDLKTKFGSTADALVSDDETTRLVTSLEEDFDEDLEAEYYMAGQEEEEEEEDGIEDLPLLTFEDVDDGADGLSPRRTGVGGGAAGREQNSSEDALEQVPQALGGATSSGHGPRDGSEQQTEHLKSEDAGGLSAAGSLGLDPLPPAAPELTGPVGALGALGIRGVFQASKAKASKVDADIHAPGKVAAERGPVLSMTEAESEQPPERGDAPPSVALGSQQHSGLAVGQGADTIPSAAASKDGNAADAVVHVSKEESRGEPTLAGGSGGDRSPSVSSAPVQGENKQQDVPRAEKDSVLGSFRPLDMLSRAAPKEASEEQRPPAPHPQPPGLEEGAPVQGRNGPGQLEQAAATEKEQLGTGKGGLWGEKAEEDFQEEEAGPVPLEADPTGQTGCAEAPDSHPGEAEAETEADEYTPEEQLEDENALSARQARGSSPASPETQDWPPSADSQGPSGAAPGTPSSVLETQGHREEAGRRSEMGGTSVDASGRAPGGPVLPEGGRALTGPGAQSLVLGWDMSGTETPQLAPEVAAGEGDHQEEVPAGSGELMDTEAVGTPDPEHGSDGLAHWPPQHLPIIGSFFKDLRSWQRFQKHVEVSELEALLQDLSARLAAAQRESLPYNAEKVLDKVFRAAEAHILSAAEQMLDARASNSQDPSARDSQVFEEAAVLDDVQDLIYFVRYQHSAAELPAPPATPPPPGDAWEGLVEELQPPTEEDFPEEKVEDLVPEPGPVPGEPSPVDAPGESTTVATEVSPESSPEEDMDAGMLGPEGSPADVIGAGKQLEIDIEDAARSTPLDGAAYLIYLCMAYLFQMLMTTLPEDGQSPGVYGFTWQPVLATAFLGIVSFVLFWRMLLEVKNKKYQVTEQQISEKVENLKKENSELAQELSNYEQKFKESKKLAQETKKLNVILSDKAAKYEDKIKKLEESNESLNNTARNLRDMLESERVQNAKNKDLILENKKSIKKLKDVISMNASELSEVQIALNEAKLSEEKVKSECHRVQEENARLKKKEDQLQQEIKEMTKSHSEMSEQIKSFAQTQKDLEVTLNHQDDDIGALTNCITQLNRLDCESEPESQNRGGNESDELANGEVAGDPPEQLKNRIRQMMDVSRTQTAVAVVEEDLKLLQSKLRASMSTKSNLEDQIKTLENERSSLLSVKSGLEEECKTLKQKVEILNELYQEKEMMLQKKLSQEEHERQEREQRLSAADEKAGLAAEEVKTYKRRIEEMEEELTKTEYSFKNQIAAHEKKAHENWLKARAAERALAEEKRESANLRQKLLEVTQKMAMLQEEPVIVKPMPGRPGVHNPPRRGPLSQNGSFGPSPVSGGECSPPPMPPMTEPPARPVSATSLSRREAPRSDFDAGPSAAPMMNNSSRSSSPSRTLDEGKPTVPQESGSSSGPSSAALTEHPVAVPMAMKGPPQFPGMPLLRGPMGGPPPPPVRYGLLPQHARPFGPRPIPPNMPTFGPGLRPPLGLKEYAPGIAPGKRDGPYDPREFIPGPAPFRPLGPPDPREYFIPGTRLPPPPHGPQDYPPPPHGPQDYPLPLHGPQDYPPPSAARNIMPSGSRDEAPPASQRGSPVASQALRQSP